MNSFKKIYFVMVIAAMLLSVNLHALRNIQVKSVEFRGIKLLSSMEIIKRTKIKEKDGLLLIDLDSLEKALTKTGIVEKYKLTKDKNNLIISIEEKQVKARIILYTRDNMLFFDLDAQNKGIQKNRIYSTQGPDFIVAADEKNSLISIVDRLNKYCSEIKKQRPDLYREIEAIRYIHRNRIYVVLYNRKTSFIAGLRMRDFLRIRSIASLLDKQKKYPSVIDVRPDRIVIGSN